MLAGINRTGLTEEEAKEVSAIFGRGLMAWLMMSLFVYLLAWAWAPALFG